jgi:hypothetical protein
VAYLYYRRLSDLAHIGGTVQLECQQCRRRAWLAAHEIWQLLGCDRPLNQLRFRCSACGSRRVNVATCRPAKDNIDRPARSFAYIPKNK